MITWYATEQLAHAEHTRRLQQAQDDQRVRRAHPPQLATRWWIALRAAWCSTGRIREQWNRAHPHAQTHGDVRTAGGSGQHR